MGSATGRSDVRRFWSKVDASAGADGCWPWLRGVDKDGYGKFQTGPSGEQKHHRAHRYAYEQEHRRAPNGVCRHTCDNPRCCNPLHLREGTQAENRADCVAKGRHARGSRHGSAILKEHQVRRIRQRLGLGDECGTIARDYGVASNTIRSIESGHTWGWL